jgi:hypothetical protein
MIIDLGGPRDVGKFLFLGHHERLPVSNAIIV